MKKDCKLCKWFCIIGCMLIYPLRGIFGWMFKKRQSINFWHKVGVGLMYAGIAIGILIVFGLICILLGYVYTLLFSYPQWLVDEVDSTLSQYLHLGEWILIVSLAVGTVVFGLWRLLRSAWRNAQRRCNKEK